MDPQTAVQAQVQQGQQDPDSDAAKLQQAMMLSMLSAQDPSAQQTPSASQSAAMAASPYIQPAPLSPMPDTSSTQVPSALASPQPDVTLAHASMADQPASKWVDQAQGQYDKFQNTPMWKRMLVPALIGATTAIGAHSRNGATLAQEGQQDTQNYTGAVTSRRNSLQQQLQAARQQQMSEYELDQRNRQQDLITAANNQQRSLASQLLAQSRQGVASTNVGGREYVADKNYDARVDSGKYAADKAQGRFNDSQDRQDDRLTRQINAGFGRQGISEGEENSRQQLGFAHSDTKPTADEDRRADMARNLNENLDALEEIAKRRPELFGMFAGRATEARQFMGTADPDVAALKTIRDQIGMAQVSAHSMRSAQQIGKAADSIMNSWHNDAPAMMASIQAARNSVGTFTQPQVRPTVAAPGARPSLTQRTKPPAAAAPEVWVRGPNGQLVQQQQVQK